MTQITLVLASIGVIQALFLCAYLFTLRTGNRQAHILLGLLLLGLSIRIGKSVFNYFLDLDPWMRNLGLAGFLMVGPSAYLYIRLLLDGVAPTRRRVIAHYFPVTMYSLFCWLIPNNYTFWAYISYSIVLLHFAIYLGAAEYRRRTAQQNGYLANELDTWLRWILGGLVIVWLFYLLVFVGVLPFYIGGAILYSLLVYAFSYLILQKHRFNLDKYASPDHPPKVMRQLLDRILQLIESERMFLDPQLKLDTVAKRLSEDPRRVSKAVNEYCGQNFPEFINGFRIAYAKDLLAQDHVRAMKITTLAQESGFGNVTSFNVAFKSMEGITPSEFRKSRNTRRKNL